MLEVNERGFKKAIALLEDYAFRLDNDANAGNKKSKIFHARENNPDFDLAVMICGDGDSNFPYRSSYFLTKFFQDLGFNYVHDGRTRRFWVQEVISELSIHEILVIIGKGLFNKWDFRKENKNEYESNYSKAINEFRLLIEASSIKENSASLDEILLTSKSSDIPKSNKNTQKEMKEIFVTYRWGGKEHSDKAIGLVNYLREQGYHAEMDQMLSQEQTAIDFMKMMHKGMTDYKKVIVILSRGYKERADNFEGGVGTEYGLIIKDIEDNPQKYILVSFNGISNEITPLNFKGREIIDLQKEENFNKLHSKIQEENLIEFSDVAKQKPTIKKVRAAEIATPLPSKKLEISGVIIESQGASLLYQKIRNIEFKFSVSLENVGNQSISDYTVEVKMPRLLTDFMSWGKVENGETIYTFNDNPKIFPKQKIRLDEIVLQISNNNVNLAEKSIVKVTVFSDDFFLEKEYKVFELAFKHQYGQKRNLTKDDFLIE